MTTKARRKVTNEQAAKVAVPVPPRGIGVDTLKAFLTANPTHKVYDYSQLELWDQCARKYSYKYLQNVHIPVDPSALFSSIVCHPTIADFYTMPHERFSEKLGGSTYLSAYLRRFQAALDNAATLLTSKQTSCYSVAVWRRALRVYYELFHQDDQVYDYANHETVYWRVLPDVPNAVWLSKPDVMLTNRIDGSPVSLEIKTSMWAFNRDLNSFDRQILSQAWTTDAATQLKVFVQFMVDRNGACQNTEVVRQVHTPDSVLLAEWLAETQFTVRQIQAAVAADVFPKRAPRACNDFNKVCAMLDVCRIGTNKQYLLAAMEHANPLEYLGL